MVWRIISINKKRVLTGLKSKKSCLYEAIWKSSVGKTPDSRFSPRSRSNIDKLPIPDGMDPVNRLPRTLSSSTVPSRLKHQSSGRVPVNWFCRRKIASKGGPISPKSIEGRVPVRSLNDKPRCCRYDSLEISHGRGPFRSLEAGKEES